MLKRLFRAGNPRKFPGWTICSPQEMAAESDAVDQLYHKATDGYWVRGFFSPEEVQRLRDGLAQWPESTQVDISFGRTYGKTLMGSDPDLRYYLDMSQRFIAELDRTLGHSFSERMGAFFRTLAGGRTVQVPCDPENRSYSPANIRELEPGKGGLHAHIGNEFIHQYPELYPLAEMAVLKDQLSYFIVLQKPESGGGLRMFDLDWENTPDRLVNGDLLYYSEERNCEMEPWYRFTLEPEAGDLILFSGGRIWHQVDNLNGELPRITIGGFCARSQDDQTFYFWS
ncbi:MAG: hypothetical protein AAF998_21905 [Bacteroidota bacterium]